MEMVMYWEGWRESFAIGLFRGRRNESARIQMYLDEKDKQAEQKEAAPLPKRLKKYRNE
jgi:hypothetical protein